VRPVSAVGHATDLETQVELVMHVDPITQSLLNITLLGELFGHDEEVAVLEQVLFDLGVDQVRMSLACAALSYATGADGRCVEILEHRVLSSEPSNDVGRALLTAALRRMGHPNWRRVAEATLSNAIHPTARQIAQRELAFP
jgi:hypothetical protein